MDEAQLRQEGFLPYRKRGFTYAKRMQIPFQVRLKSGDTIYGAKGDYVCTDSETSERWIVADDIFEDTYRHISRANVPLSKRNRLLEHYRFHIYHKIALTWARQLAQPMMVNTLEGPVSAQTGEYLCVGAKGEQWPQLRDRFEENYEMVKEAIS